MKNSGTLLKTLRRKATPPPRALLLTGLWALSVPAPADPPGAAGPARTCLLSPRVPRHRRVLRSARVGLSVPGVGDGVGTGSPSPCTSGCADRLQYSQEVGSEGLPARASSLSGVRRGNATNTDLDKARVLQLSGKT